MASRKKPWPHQAAAVAWLLARLYGYLNHEMGCGKTLVAILATAGCRNTLVVCPIAVGPAWIAQVASSGDSRRVCLAVEGSAARRAERIKEALSSDEPTIVVINYDSVWRPEIAKVIAGTQWDAVILDESHRIKSHTGKASKFLCKLAERQPQAKRLCLSGTPTPKDPLDWYAQLKFLDPEILGCSYPAFRNRIANTHPKYPGWVTGFRDEGLAALRERIDQHIHRVKSDEVLDLPDAIHTVIDVEITGKTRKFYDSLENDMIGFLDGEPVTASNQLVVVSRLRTAAGGYTRVDGSQEFEQIDGTPAKSEIFADWLEDFPKGEPLVVFCSFVRDIAEVVWQCRKAGRTVSELRGGVNQLEEWQSGATDVIVIQQQSGGAGIDCTRASHCCYYSVGHSLGDFDQSLARLRRPGQTKTCRYYHFVVKNTVEETIYSALQNKRDVVEEVLSRLTRRVAK
jgi:SNF2 family DNA or RNA helicase